jgi:hypothetical protein
MSVIGPFLRCKRRRGLRPEADGDVHSLGYQITHFIAGQKFKLELRIPGAESGQMWREYQTREERIDIYAQPASDSLGRAGRKYRGFFDAVEVWM